MREEDTKDRAAGLTATELAAALTVKDLAASEAWYRDILGFAIDRRHERDGRLIALSLHAGQVRLLLSQDDGAHGPDRIMGAGFSLQLTTAQDIDALANGIQHTLGRAGLPHP
jgi:catechol 2,3-dioxygenase-like lactoylglutathione lyase family enzyme